MILASVATSAALTLARPQRAIKTEGARAAEWDKEAEEEELLLQMWLLLAGPTPESPAGTFVPMEPPLGKSSRKAALHVRFAKASPSAHSPTRPEKAGQ